MRRRGVRVFTLIAVIGALSLATLAGVDFGRGGEGLLGLTLGLDLQGGSHLEYQADLPDTVQVTFQEPVEESRLRTVLGDLGQKNATIDRVEYTLGDLSLEEKALDELRVAMETLAPIAAFSTSDGFLEVTFEVASEDQVATGDNGAPAEADLRRVLDVLGYSEATLLASDDNTYTVSQLDLAEVASGNLLRALETGLSPIDVFEGSKGNFNVIFRDPLGEGELRTSLDVEGFTEATIESPPQESYSLGQLTLDGAAAEEMRRALAAELVPIKEPGGFVTNIVEPTQEQMKGVERIITRRINVLGTTEPIIQRLGEDRIVVQLPGAGGSTVDVTFRSAQDMLAEIGFALEAMGHAGATVRRSGVSSYVISTEEPLAQRDLDATRALAGSLAPGVEVEVSGDDGREITIHFPPPPGEATIEAVVAGTGLTDYTVQQRDPDQPIIRFTVSTEKVLTTQQRGRLEEALEAKVARIADFQVSGSIEEAKELIGGTAQLVFVERQCLLSLEEIQAARVAGFPDPCDPVGQGGGGRDGVEFVDTVIELTGEDLASAFPGRDPTTNAPEVNLEFKGRGRDVFSNLTARLVGDPLRRLAIFLDDEQIFAATVSARITDGRTRITGRFTRQQTITIANQLESGRLPVPLALTREFTVDAILGADSLRKSLIAGMVGLGLVLLFMVVYYRMAGLVAATALLIYAVIVLAIFKLVPVTLTLSGIAGIILSIGMAVDANILIFERMKEELRTGRTLASSMEVGFRRAWVAIRDGNVSTIITCAILFLFGSRLGGGTPVVTGFAVTLLIGVSVSMFTAITVSRNLLQILALTPIGRRRALFSPEPQRRPVGVVGGGH